MAGSPIFSVNFTNRKNSAVLNYHKSWSWSNQPVLWDFYIMFLLVSSLWMFVTIFCPKHGVTVNVWRHNFLTFRTASAENQQKKSSLRGGSRGRVQGVRTPPEMTCGFLIQLVFSKKKKTMWLIGVEVEQETSAPPPKKRPGSAPATASGKH